MKFVIKDAANIQQSLEAIVSYVKEHYSENIKNASVYITLENTNTKNDEFSVSGTDIYKGNEVVFSRDQYELVDKLKNEISRYKHEYYIRIKEAKRQIGLDNLYIDDERHPKDQREKRIKARDAHKKEFVEYQRCFNDALKNFNIDAAVLQFTHENDETTLTAHDDKCTFVIKKSSNGISEASFTLND